MLRYENTAKRVDLDFRLHHIELETKIFEIDDRVYRIYCKGYVGTFAELEKEFNYEFRPLGKDIGLVISKGVFLSFVCVFTVMPSLILWFDELVAKCDKNALKIALKKKLAESNGGDGNV